MSAAEANLCQRGGFAPDRQQRADYSTTGIPADYFTCADLSNGINIWPCTGSKHVGSVLVTCTCPCHKIGGPQ